MAKKLAAPKIAAQKLATEKPESDKSSTKLWGGRFTGKNDPLMERFNASIAFDQRMWAADVQGSQAYARAIALVGIITQSEADQIDAGLEQVATEWSAGSFTFTAADEDIHTANERRLTAEVLTRRVRHFTQGVIFGSRAVACVGRVLARNRRAISREEARS